MFGRLLDNVTSVEVSNNDLGIQSFLLRVGQDEVINWLRAVLARTGRAPGMRLEEATDTLIILHINTSSELTINVYHKHIMVQGKTYAVSESERQKLDAIIRGIVSSEK
jgi:hypothetical protein